MQVAPLMRLTVIEVGNQCYRVLWSSHHVLSDGWSTPIVLKQVMKNYAALRVGHRIEPTHEIPYKHYVEWVFSQDTARARRYWEGRLKGMSGPVVLRDYEQERTHAQAEETGYGQLSLHWDSAHTTRLKHLAQREGVTLNTVLLGAWSVLLHRYTGLDDMVMGTVLSGRPAELRGVEQMVGLFINTLPLRVQYQGGTALGAWLKEIHQSQNELIDYQSTSLVEVQRASGLPVTTPLFEHIVVFENYPVEKAELSVDEIKISRIESHEQTNYGLLLTAFVREGCFEVGCQYSKARYGEGWVNRLLGHLDHLLQSLMDISSTAAIAELEMLGERERQQLLLAWNNTSADYPSHTVIHALFEAQVERTPDNMAVVFEDQGLSYGELNAKANQVAHYLRERGVTSDTLVGICVERSLEMVIGLLGILKAGGAYVPIDPSYPKERIDYILHDANVNICLTQASLLPLFSDGGVNAICVDAWEHFKPCSTQNLNTPLYPLSAAYVIYTSGSTGRPKGVVVSHGGIVNIVTDRQRAIHLDERDRVGGLTPLGFDIASAEIYLPLLSGATLCVGDKDLLRDGERLVRYIDQNAITYLQATPGSWQMLLTSGIGRERLREVVSTGEALSAGLMQELTQRFGRVWNLFGPTETTIWSLGRVLEEQALSVDIGSPLSNTQSYLVDREYSLVPLGVVESFTLAVWD